MEHDLDAMQAHVLAASSLAQAQSLARAFAPAPSGLLAGLFPCCPPGDTQRKTRASSKAFIWDEGQNTLPRLPKEVFWHILAFWADEPVLNVHDHYFNRDTPKEPENWRAEAGLDPYLGAESGCEEEYM